MLVNTACLFLADITPLWEDNESWQNECVVVNLTSGLLETTNCYAQNAFLCYSLNDASKFNSYRHVR